MVPSDNSVDSIVATYEAYEQGILDYDSATAFFQHLFDTGRAWDRDLPEAIMLRVMRMLQDGRVLVRSHVEKAKTDSPLS